MKISIITPAHNEENVIRNCILSVKNLEIPEGFSIEHIVVADRCTDKTVEICKKMGVRVIIKKWRGNAADPVTEAVDLGVKESDGQLIGKIDADMIEIHTGAFCDATTNVQKQREFSRIIDAAKIGTKLKLEVNAGHGICYNTIKAFKGLSEISEFSIGHSIVARALLTGMEQAVRDMKQLIFRL